MLCWNPDSDQVALVRWCGEYDRSIGYLMTDFACCSRYQEEPFEGRKTLVFIQAMHLIIRDRVDPMAVHRALLGLREYVDGLAPDVPR